MVLPVVASVAVLAILVELWRPGRPWPRMPSWWARAIALNACQIGVVFLATATWDVWLAEHPLWNAKGLGLWGGAALGYVVITFLYYWWHRWRHEVPFLWRWVHQVHHSPARIEIITSFYKHPIELVLNGVLSSAILYFLVGLGVEATALAVLFTGIAELFYHWNVRTPYWLGFFIQRPESHCVHHQRGLHHYNYGDLPLWDMLFGTFRNPRSWQGECGFGDDKELQLSRMLRGEDVNS